MEETLEKTQNSKEKRLDLQGIRGIAIISVILFHFFPHFFPNGYVGVDQFFVLSGFLMCMLLKKSSSNCSSYNFEWITNFYIRRLKRIVPLYFLLIFLTLLAIFTIFPYTSIESNINSARNALIFKSNRLQTDDDDYYAMLSLAIDVFTHTWSLSVEVQFYLLVPFIYFVGAKLDQYSKWLEILYHLTIGISSFIYSIFYCTEEFAFHSVLARVWQFSVGMFADAFFDARHILGCKTKLVTGAIFRYFSGMIAYLIVAEKTSNSEENYALLSENEEELPQKKTTFSTTNYKNLLTIMIIILSIYPKEIQFVRLFQTILTGILMCFSDEMIIKSNNFMILESKCLIYFGNISYSLYLIHWPIYAFWKLNLSNGNDWILMLFISLAFSILLAVLSYELFEKWYLKQTNQLILILSLTLFTLNMGLLYQKDISNWISPPEITNRLDGLHDGERVSYYKAEKMNREWAAGDRPAMIPPTCEYDKHGAYGFCRHTGLDTKNGKFKFMLLGNSYSANHGRLFYEECAHKANSIVQVSVPACEPLHPWSERLEKCTKAIKEDEEKVEQEKPDYLFIFSRFMEIGDPMPPNITSLDMDPIYQKMKKQLEIYLKSVKYKVFLMNQLARIHAYEIGSFAKTVLEKKDLVAFDKSVVVRDPDMARLRYEKLTAECSKCALFDYKPYFFNETTQTWRFYDEQQAGLSYMTGGQHLSFHGLELIRPVIRDICGSF